MLYPTELWAEMICSRMKRSAGPSKRSLMAGAAKVLHYAFFIIGFQCCHSVKDDCG
jgi:hypothetical protein